jgi:heme-degrading monooxygenase HmoA
MVELAAAQPGYLGMDSVSAPTGDMEKKGITVSYWQDLESIKQWKQNSEHLLAQKLGRKDWYRSYRVRICRVEREYGFEHDSELESEFTVEESSKQGVTVA